MRLRLWMSLLLLVMTPACGALPEPLSRLLEPTSSPRAPAASARRTVHVYVPPGAEAAGTRVPLLYVGDGEARFFPEGAGDASSSRVPRPSELVALLRRQDIVIVTVDSEPAPPDGQARSLTLTLSPAT